MSALADKSLNIPGTSALPTYASATEVELAGIAPLTSTASLPPAYDDATATVTVPAGSDDTLGSSDGPPRAPFAPTVHFQIETEGKPWLSLPIGTRPDPIPVYRVEAGSWAPGSTPAYVSLRSSRSSNNCSLVRGDDDGSQMPVCTTLYRFGPGKPPVLRLPRALISPHAGPASPACPPGERAHGDVRTEGDGDLDLLVMPKSLVTRTQVLETPLGTFQWRYASRREVTAAERADDLLVCELVTRVALAGRRKAREETARVAQLVRGPGTRTEGTGRSAAGNGGRLAIDLARWTGPKGGMRDAVEALVIASCVCMLKKEVDRRRMHQMMIMAGAASGGG
ncbi:hypothetical protein LZ32DRAFT_601461 [Colletotrichum eremochloae]|nr:hypothetical protein LZ32DRAFT_601461 [Colletotrichum eremochloae]